RDWRPAGIRLDDRRIVGERGPGRPLVQYHLHAAADLCGAVRVGAPLIRVNLSRGSAAASPSSLVGEGRGGGSGGAPVTTREGPTCDCSRGYTGPIQRTRLGPDQQSRPCPKSDPEAPTDALRHPLPTHFFAPLYRPVRPDEYLSHFNSLLVTGCFFSFFLIFCNIAGSGNRGPSRSRCPACRVRVGQTRLFWMLQTMH